MTIEEAFGIVVRRLRREQNFSQEKLSVSSSLDRTFISNIEGGKQQPSLISIFTLASALKVSVSNVMREVELILEVNFPDKCLPNAQKELLQWINNMECYMDKIQDIYKGTETILLADDELQLLNMLSQFLCSCGYDVLTACNGLEALDKFRQHPGKIHLVILDIVMPCMNGLTAHKEIRQLSPDTSIILVSGYYPEGFKEHDIALQIVQKPFSPVEMLKKIRSTLDENQR